MGISFNWHPIRNDVVHPHNKTQQKYSYLTLALALSKRTMVSEVHKFVVAVAKDSRHPSKDTVEYSPHQQPVGSAVPPISEQQ
eukprot:scaffold3189_cov141-Skeletonema_menzelii.AAC.1